MSVFSKIKLKQLPEINLLAVFFIHLLAYSFFLKLWLCNEDLNNHELFFTITRQISDFTLLSLTLFYYISYRDRWRYSLRFLLYCITLLYVINIFYIILEYEPELYYAISCFIVYSIGVVVSIWVLTRR